MSELGKLHNMQEVMELKAEIPVKQFSKLGRHEALGNQASECGGSRRL